MGLYQEFYSIRCLTHNKKILKIIIKKFLEVQYEYLKFDSEYIYSNLYKKLMVKLHIFVVNIYFKFSHNFLYYLTLFFITFSFIFVIFIV